MMSLEWKQNLQTEESKATCGKTHLKKDPYITERNFQQL